MRNSFRRRIDLEGLEGRALLAAGFTLVDTLTAKDTLDLDRLGAFSGIETLRSQNATELQTVIANGAAATQVIGTQYAALQVQYQQAVAAGDKSIATSVKHAEEVLLTNGAEVRLIMRQATAVASAVDDALKVDENQVNALYRDAIGKLARHANPFTLLPPVANAISTLEATAQTQVNHGTTALSALNSKITS